jgi:hypothetical protein
MIKILALTNNLILISKIEEVGSELGEPDCKIIKPFVIRNDKTMEPFLCGFVNQDVFMISSDQILTIADPKPTILEKYQDLIK